MPRAQVEARDPAVLKSLIMMSDQIGMIAKLGVEKEVANGLLKFVEIELPLMLRPIGIVRRQHEPISPGIDFLIRIIEDDLHHS